MALGWCTHHGSDNLIVYTFNGVVRSYELSNKANLRWRNVALGQAQPVLKVSESNRTLLIALANGEACVIDVATGKVLHRFESPAGAINAAASGSGTGLVWLLGTGNNVFEFDTEACLQTSPVIKLIPEVNRAFTVQRIAFDAKSQSLRCFVVGPKGPTIVTAKMGVSHTTDQAAELAKRERANPR